MQNSLSKIINGVWDFEKTYIYMDPEIKCNCVEKNINTESVEKALLWKFENKSYRSFLDSFTCYIDK